MRVAKIDLERVNLLSGVSNDLEELLFIEDFVKFATRSLKKVDTIIIWLKKKKSSLDTFQ